jgi:uncharacterized RDD family membrane protein YckC
MTMTMTYVIVALIAFFIWLGKVIPYRTQRLIWAWFWSVLLFASIAASGYHWARTGEFVLPLPDRGDYHDAQGS